MNQQATGTSEWITFVLPRLLADQIREIATREGNSKSAVIRRLISRGLAQEPAGAQA